MTVVNAHILYCKANNQIPLLDFRRSIAQSYMSLPSISDPKKSGRPSFSKLSSKSVSESLRFDAQGHYIERTENRKQRKCAICKSNARKQCTKCNVGLHLDCFLAWHKK